MTKKTNIRRANQIKSSDDAKQFLRYLKLRIQKLSGYKTFKTDCSTICTRNYIITIGEEYQYKEGHMLERIIIEDISFRHFFIYVKVHFIEMDRTITVSHVMKNMGYMGMWRIWDKDHFDIEEWKRDFEPVDQAALDSLPVIYV